MSRADEPQPTVPPESLDAADAAAESAPLETPETPAGKKGKKKKEKKKREKKAKPAKTESLSEESGEEKPRRRFSLSDLSVYTVMLMIAFGFLLVGCVLLWIELNRYGFDFRAQGTP